MNIICFSDIYWDFLWQRHQHILTRFPLTWKILFLEPPSFRAIREDTKRIFPRKIRNIILISLPLIPFFEKNKILRIIADFLVFLYAKIFTYIFGMKKPVLIFYDPRFSCLIGLFNEKLVLFEFIDNKLGFSETPEWMKYYINLLMKKADLITTSSSNLYEMALASGAKKVFLIKNAADLSFFKNNNTGEPDDIRHLKKPIIGYAGIIHDWFDYELIEKIAIKFYNSTVLLIGPIQYKQWKKVISLKKYDNIIFTGKKNYNELPGYINRFNVAIIPFSINTITNYVNPVKLYEYFAAGKPVVCTALPDIYEYKDVIYIANSHEEFLEFIEVSLNTEMTSERYFHILKDNSWDNRASQIISLIENYSKYH